MLIAVKKSQNMGLLLSSNLLSQMSATIVIRYVTSNLPTSQLSSSLKLIDIIVGV